MTYPSDVIQRVQARCHEVGECWEWTGALQQAGCTPTISWQGRPMGVRRLVMLSMGVEVGTRVVTARCGNRLCVAPEHLQAVTRAVLSRRTCKATDYSSLARSMRLAQRVRASHRAKLSPEIAAEIRASEGVTQRELAARYGVSQYAISCVIRGRTWRDYYSPFAQLLFGGKP